MGQSKRKSPSLRRAFGASWRTISHDLFNTYHPERHYMRGPGPKWREKHGEAPAPQGYEPASPEMTAAHA